MAQKLRLDRLLSNLGYGPRRQIQSHIRKGKFVLSGRAISDPPRFGKSRNFTSCSQQRKYPGDRYKQWI